MDKMSLREAVKHFNVSRPTLQKALKSGKVSGVQDGKGQWQVDPSELARVYQARSANAEKVGKALPGNLSTQNRGLSASVDAEVGHDIATRLAVAEAALDAEREKTAMLQRHLDDVRRMLPPPDDVPTRRRWWPW